MEYSVKDRLLSLIFPALCVVYGLLEFRIYLFDNRPFGIALFNNAGAILAILGGVITGFIAVRLKIDFEPYLKVLTIGTVLAFMFYIMIVMQFAWFEIGEIYHVVILFIAVFLMTVKMPAEADARDRLVAAFANPVLYSLLNRLCKYLLSYLYDVGALA